jgi:hypothetical protein
VLLAGGLVVPAILAGCARGSVDTDTTESVAVVEDLFARLEAGRASDAAALTMVDLDEDLVDDDFYRTSVARPTAEISGERLWRPRLGTSMPTDSNTACSSVRVQPAASASL